MNKDNIIDRLSEKKKPSKKSKAPKINDTPLEDLLTVSQMAEIFKCSTATIYRWYKKGLIPFLIVGRSVYFPKSQVMIFLEKKRSNWQQS